MTGMHFVLAMLLVFVQASDVEAATQDAGCPKVAGLIAGPWVNTEQAARQIFEAIAAGIVPNSFMQRYETKIVDQGEKWVIYQTPKVASQPTPSRPTQSNGPIFGEVILGGGGLTMEIAKCDGTISSVHFQR